MGYGCYFVDSGELKEIKEMTDKTIETNFFFLHADKHFNIIKELLHG